MASKQPKESALLTSAKPVSSRIVVLADKGRQDKECVAILEQAGYQVDVINSLESLRSICGTGSIPAALILDIVPAKKSAHELAAALAGMQAQCQGRIPVIFPASPEDIAARLAAYRAGATRYIPKPVQTRRLLAMIAEAAPLLPQQPYRVILVGDATAEQQVQAESLRDAGMQVRISNDPLQLPAMQKNFAADVLVLSLEMRQCGGLELAAVLLDEQLAEEAQIIFLTSETDLVQTVIQQLHAINSSNENYMNRLVAPGQLAAMVNKQAQRHRQNLKQAETLRGARYELERQQQALDAHAIVSVGDINGNIVYANEKFCEVSGYSLGELIGKNHRIIKSGMHPPEFYAGMWDTIVKGGIWHGEVCNRRKDGSFYWVDTSIVPFVDAEGFPYHYISIRTDITHVKENEQRLIRSQAFANIGTWDWNIQTGELDWSERIAPLFGYPEGKLARSYENFLNAIHPDDMQRVGDAIRDCVERGIAYHIEHRCVWPDGSTRWLLESGDVVRDANGTPLHMLGLVQDITPRKQAELGLVESNESLEEAQSLAHLGNWEADMVSGELHWSDEIYRIFGLDKKRFTPTVAAFRNAVHPDDMALVEQSEKLAAASGVHDVVHRIIRPDGTVRYVHELARGVAGTDGRLLRLRGTVQDVTELKLAEEAMLQAKEAAEAASRAKSEFLASMSHELRTPLNAILGYSQLFIMDEQLPRETRDNSRQIEIAGKHLLSLVNGLLDLARIESNRLELSMQAVALKDVVCDSLNMVQSMANDRNIRIILMQCESMDIVVYADFNRLRQSLINLLTNAIKYNKPNGTVHMLCESAGGAVHIAVTDTGPGIAAEKHARIFNAFDRLGQERGEIEGSGIGLVITKRIVEAMGGKLGFESTVGQGSTFWLEFPVSESSKGAESGALPHSGTATVAQAAAAMPESKSSVLYIEDNEMNLRLMQQIFSGKHKWALCSATSAERGIAMARENPPRLVLMDINLPGMDGYQAMSILKADPLTANIPIVALTANAMKGDRERGLEEGFADYLTKPLDIRQLMVVLDRLLD